MMHNLALLTAFVASVTAHCTRPLLKEAVDAYLLAQQTGQPTPFTTHFDNSTWLGYRENSLTVNITASLLATPLPITHTRSFYDTSSCATFTEVVVNSTTTPFVIGTQLRFTNHKINKVDSIVTRPGDWLFNVTGYAHWTAQERWDAIPEEKRDSQLALRKAADAYLDLFDDKNVTVPWGTPCVRLEGGLYGDAGPNATCAVGVPSGVPLSNRRYVVDEVVGSVDVLLDFGRSKWPDSHLFRVEAGRLRYVHTLTHCGVANCGV
jgi:hypothetical protein